MAGWLHASGEWVDVVATVLARPFVLRGVRVRGDIPNRLHGETVDLPHLGEGERLDPIGLVLRLDGLAVEWWASSNQIPRQMSEASWGFGRPPMRSFSSAI